MGAFFRLDSANLNLDCMSCEDPEGSGGYLSLSDGGHNLTLAQARGRVKTHLAKHPGHEICWSAMGTLGDLT